MDLLTRRDLAMQAFRNAGRAHDGRPTIDHVAMEAGVHRGTVSSARGAETIEKIDRALAALHGFDYARFRAYLDGAEDPELGDLLAFRARIFRCTGPGPCPQSRRAELEPGWYDPEADGDLITLELRRCKPCQRTPGARAWQDLVDQAMPQIADRLADLLAKNPKLREHLTVQDAVRLQEAWEIAKAKPARAIHYSGLSSLSKIPADKLQFLWMVLGLPERPTKSRRTPRIMTLITTLLAATSIGAGGLSTDLYKHNVPQKTPIRYIPSTGSTRRKRGSSDGRTTAKAGAADSDTVRARSKPQSKSKSPKKTPPPPPPPARRRPAGGKKRGAGGAGGEPIAVPLAAAGGGR